MSAAVGIDLGTSNSAVAAFFQGKHQILADEEGHRLTPSVVSFGKDKKILVGLDAKAQTFSNPKKTVMSIKRLIGRKIFSPEVKKSQVLLPYKLVETEDQNVGVEVDGAVFSPQEISALILRHMKDIATLRLGEEVTEAVITVPAHFNDNQRQATKDACKIAGLEALRIINEPTAAALAYGFGKNLKEKVAIYDLGGGTFDISILRLKDEVFEVIATAGDTFLGGDDFDDRIIDLCAEHFLKKSNIDLRKIAEALPLLRQNAEKAKRKLSYAEKTDIIIPQIVKKDGEPIDFQYTLSREIFQKSTSDLIQKTFAVCDEALRTANMKPSDLDAVILVGGPSKMNLIYEVVATYFGKPPLRDLNPDEVVAIGASIQASSLKGPQSKSAQSDQGTAADPDKTLVDAQPEALLLDVTPLDLGIATVGGYTETLIEANSPIPTQSARLFTTTKDDQSAVSIRIFQGKNRREETSTLLGEFDLSGFRSAKAGEVAIDVLFSINSDGIVEVSAKDTETGKSQSVKVRLTAALDAAKLSETSKRSKTHKEVKLKDEWKDATKVVFCLPSAGGAVYEDGYVRDFDPQVAVFTVFQEGSTKGKQKALERAKLGWLMTIDDFSNIPRYIRAVTEKPAAIENKLKAQLYHFKLRDGTSIYGQSALPKVRELGFWIEPYFARDELPGKLFIYSSGIEEASPINL